MKFIIEMDTDLYCKCNQLTEWFGEPTACQFGLRPCGGDLTDRPEWCPLYPIGESEEIWIDAIKDAREIIRGMKNEPR